VALELGLEDDGVALLGGEIVAFFFVLCDEAGRGCAVVVEPVVDGLGEFGAGR
jgi:hypothetical protein